nr:hypothetical protein [uncultured Haemophilus sp.]
MHTSALAIGDEAYSDGARGIAIGRFARSTGEEAIALGSSNQQNYENNNRTIASGKRAVAIGPKATASLENGIALGFESNTTIDKGATGFDASQDADGARTNKYTNLTNNVGKARISTLARLSIGDTDKTRQINHLAAGTQDTDAVNVAQLKSVNLAFQGDSGKGDVRLYDQRLSVVGKTGSFITTTASDKKIEIGTTTGTFKVNNNGKFETTGNGYVNGLATVEAISNAVNLSGWKLSHNSEQNGIVKLGDEVNFANGEGTTVSIDGTEGKRVVKVNTNIEAGSNISITKANGKLTISAADTNTQASVSAADNSAVSVASSGPNNAKNYALDVKVDGKTITKTADGKLQGTKYVSIKSSGGTNEDNTGAKGQDAIAIGKNSHADKINSTAVGFESNASGTNSMALGYGSQAIGDSSIALGNSAEYGKEKKVVHTVAKGKDSIALGGYASALNEKSIAIGFHANATTVQSTALGYGAKTEAAGGVAIGINAWNKPGFVVGVAIGNNAISESLRGVALGSRSYADVGGGKTGVSMDSDDRKNVYENLSKNVDNAKISGENGAVSIGIGRTVTTLASDVAAPNVNLLPLPLAIRKLKLAQQQAHLKSIITANLKPQAIIMLTDLPLWKPYRML